MQHGIRKLKRRELRRAPKQGAHTMPSYRPLCAAVILGLVAPNAMAGGLWLNEFGTPAMGKARAGSIADVRDASAALHNPAAMAKIERRQWMLAPMGVVSQVEFDVAQSNFLNSNGDGGDAGGFAPAVTAAYVHQFNDKWTFGVSAAGTTGAALDYGSDWTGRFQAQEVELLGLAVMPSAAYEFTEEFSVGFGLAMMYTELELTVAVPSLPLTIPLGPEGSATIDGSDLILGYNFSAHWQLSPRTQLGLVLQSEFEAEYDGDAEFEPLGAMVGVDTDLLLAKTVRLGFSHRLSEKLAISATVGWDGWSDLQAVNISAEGDGIVKPRNWDDTYHYALGLDYELGNNYKLSTGVSYDTNPVSSSDRTADMPLDRQVRLAMGVRKQVRPDLEVGVNVVYEDLGSAAIDAHFFAGDYKTNQVLFVGVSFNWLLD